VNALWDKGVIYKILFIFLCLGLILGIVFYLNQINRVKAEQATTSVTVTIEPYCGDEVCNGSETCSTCQADCGTCPASPGGGGGGGGAIPPPLTTKVILQGKAYPAAYLTILKDGQIAGNTQADSNADFKFEISNITAGIYTFGIWAEDKNKVKSITFSFTVNVIRNVITTINGIFLSPSISLDRNTVNKGETLNILGMTAPQSQIELHIGSDQIIEEFLAGIDGIWFYAFDTNRVTKGIHSARAKASTVDGLMSTFGQTLLFGVGIDLPTGQGICPNADLNKDGRVNLIDFSILLYWWGGSDECADQNSDGRVDLIDFSIMLYHWTG